jgi:hypothetical protein
MQVIYDASWGRMYDKNPQGDRNGTVMGRLCKVHGHGLKTDKRL